MCASLPGPQLYNAQQFLLTTTLWAWPQVGVPGLRSYKVDFITNAILQRVIWHEITILQLICSFCCVIMLRLLLIVVLLGTLTVPVPSVTAVKGLMYMREIDDTFDEFLASSDNIKVVYFCKGTWHNVCAVCFHRIYVFHTMRWWMMIKVSSQNVPKPKRPRMYGQNVPRSVSQNVPKQNVPGADQSFLTYRMWR